MEGEVSRVRRSYPDLLVGGLRFLVRPLSLLVLSVLAGLIALVLPWAYLELHRDKVLTGVTVLGAAVGGQDAATAREVLREATARVEASPLTLEAGGHRWSVRPGDIGIKIDADLTLAQVLSLGRNEFPTRAGIKAASILIWGLNYPAALRVDEARLRGFLEEVAGRVRVPARDAGLAVRDGWIERIIDQPGVRLDMEAAERVILQAVATRGSWAEISLPFTVDAPHLNWHTVAPYEQRLAHSLQRPITLTAGSYVKEVPSQELWALVKGTLYDPSAPDGVGLILAPDRASALLADFQLRVGTPSKDAQIRVTEDGQVVVEPEHVGTGVTPRGLQRALTDAILREAPIAAVPIEPMAPPVVKAEDLAEARARTEAMLFRPLILFYGDLSWPMTRSQLASAVRFLGVGKGTEPKLDIDRLSEVISAIPFALDEPGKIQRVAWWGGPVVAGRVVDPRATAQAVAEAVERGDSFVEVRFQPSLPKLPPAQMPPERPAKWIDINLSTQELVAYQGDNAVYYTLVSTGRPGHATPTGTFRIYIKLVKDSMSNGTFGVGPDDPDYYNLKDVPYVMYFLTGGYAIHGTYWHNNFGHVMSHGCVNAPTPAAQWLFQWAELGTPVVVHY